MFKCLACIYVCAPHVCLMPIVITAGPRYPGTDCEPLCGYWEPNLGPMLEQQVLLWNHLSSPLFVLKGLTTESELFSVESSWIPLLDNRATLKSTPVTPAVAELRQEDA